MVRLIVLLLLVTLCCCEDCTNDETAGTNSLKSCKKKSNCGYITREECNTNVMCSWEDNSCRNKGSHVEEMFTDEEDHCKKCTDWYKADKASGMEWLKHLNENFKCPCRVNQTHSLIRWLDHLVEIDNPSNRIWVRDLACRANGEPRCSYYHPGANGCLRSLNADKPSGAGQQCCYDKDGFLLKAGSAGSGTPDKGHSIWSPIDHKKFDVDPFITCCKKCKREIECNYYIKELRKGDSSHCPEKHK